jgi:hypothetical protein
VTTRKRSEQVEFCRPFVLTGVGELQPAGFYTVDTEEELLDALAVAEWRHMATVIHLTRGGATQYQRVDPTELHKALMRDGAQRDHAQASFHAKRKRRRSARKMMNAPRGPRSTE